MPIGRMGVFADAQKPTAWANPGGLQQSCRNGAAHGFYGAVVEGGDLPNSHQGTLIDTVRCRKSLDRPGCSGGKSLVQSFVLGWGSFGTLDDTRSHPGFWGTSCGAHHARSGTTYCGSVKALRQHARFRQVGRDQRCVVMIVISRSELLPSQATVRAGALPPWRHPDAASQPAS